MEIVVKGRNVEVPEHFRTHVADKLTRSERYDSKIIRVDVELSHEANRRQSKNCQRVQITVASRGPAIRAEDCADNFYAALDGAVIKLETRLRKAADRRHDRQHERTPIAAVPLDTDELAADSAIAGAGDGVLGSAQRNGAARVDGHPIDGGTERPDTGLPRTAVAVLDEQAFRWQDDDHGDSSDGEPGRIVRIKRHPDEPISVDQALLRMELVGHDFYLFNDADTGLPSVVYRRKGFNYGLLRLGD